jgi:hypothetical protein
MTEVVEASCGLMIDLIEDDRVCYRRMDSFRGYLERMIIFVIDSVCVKAKIKALGVCKERTRLGWGSGSTP